MHRIPARPASTQALTPVTWFVVLAVGALTAWGAWARRWMSDDGLIILRTVRNLIAGNGPVFNAGERVEVNTSTAWQYLIYAGQRLSGARLEEVALALALGFSVVALMLATWATAGFYRATPVAPAGVLIYLALPPARDFMTSGLEWGMSLFYLAALWALLLKWVLRPEGKVALVLAFWAGLSWLVRPEFIIYGGVVGILLLAYCQRRLLVLAVALPVPLAYEIFRMGYYGLLYPNTAVAKSATGSAWAEGLAYLQNFVYPYWLFVPVAVLVVAAVVAIRAHFDSTMVVPLAVMEGCGLIHALYVVRVGGDFMHGRMLLLPLFALLLPVFVLPVKNWITAVLLAGIGLWALVIAWRGNANDWSGFDHPRGILDEREYWTYAIGAPPGRPPLYAEQFRSAKSMEDFDLGIAGLKGGDAIAMRYLSSSEHKTFSWLTVPRDPARQDPPTLYLVNAGLSSMNAPLDVRVLDNVGLTTPLASRQPRLAEARIGHDKQLAREWQVADSAAALGDLPPWVDEDEAVTARQALGTPEIKQFLATYRDPLDARRFFDNITWSLTKGRTLQLSSDPAEYR